MGPKAVPAPRVSAGTRNALERVTAAAEEPVDNIGSSHPLGATVVAGGVNFSLFSRSASAMELLFFDREDDARPARVIRIDPADNRTYHYWHVFVPGIQAGQLYGFRVHGPFDPDSGFRFDPSKLLLDPYSRAVVVPKNYNRDAARMEGDNASTAMKSVMVDPSAYDWEGDKPLKRPSSRTIVYEMHVRGFTAHANSGVPDKKRGTYAGLIEKIPYLQQLGITAVELLPVFQFDAQDCPPGRVNYWGYAPVSFFAPHQAYSSRQDPLGPVDEFRDLVKALHRAGIEVILDVVFNHTAEGDHGGPTLCHPRDRQQHLLHPRARPFSVCQFQRHREHDQRQSSGCPPHDRGQSSLLGRGNARGWFPVRSRLYPCARFVRSRDVQPDCAVGHRIRSRSRRDKDDRGGMGCGGPVPGGQLRGRQLEGVERTVSRRCPRLLPWCGSFGDPHCGPFPW